MRARQKVAERATAGTYGRSTPTRAVDQRARRAACGYSTSQADSAQAVLASCRWITFKGGEAVTERFETKSLGLMAGQSVSVKVLSHHPWGVLVEVAGYEDAGLSASIDMIAQFGRATSSYDELLALFPPVGSHVDAVIEQIHRWDPPVYVRLSIHPADLASLVWRCDFCDGQVTVSAGGNGLVLDVRSNDGPGSHTVISHRQCLADRIHPQHNGERARALKIGTPVQPPKAND